jgi:hypothetical protein
MVRLQSISYHAIAYIRFDVDIPPIPTLHHWNPLIPSSRDLTRDARKTLYIVYKPDTRVQLGIGVPSSLYAQACQLAATTRSDRREAVLRKDARVSRLADSTVARLYPHMPEPDRIAAVEHGYRKRSGRVGRTGELDEDNRARRVVVAYARHKWTAYDSLLQSLAKEGGDSEAIRRQARAMAKDQLEGVLKLWRTGAKK